MIYITMRQVQAEAGEEEVEKEEEVSD